MCPTSSDQDYEFEVNRRYNTPEKNLWCALLERAVRDYFRIKPEMQDYAFLSTGGTELEYQRLVEWFGSRRNEVGDFAWICRILEIDVASMRKRIFGFEIPEGGFKKRGTKEFSNPLLNR